MAHSIYLANKLNDYVLKGTAYSAPTDVWIALFTADTGLDTNAPTAEVSGNAYARLEINNVLRSFTASAAKESSNNEAWEFPTATGLWGDITHVAVMDAVTAGNVLYWGALTAPTTIDDTNVFRFLAGAFDSLYS